jgi:hypothetical protein
MICKWICNEIMMDEEERAQEGKIWRKAFHVGAGKYCLRRILARDDSKSFIAGKHDINKYTLPNR